MSSTGATKSSNSVGVSISEEATPKVLAGSPIWYDRTVKVHNDFGANITNEAAETINPSRQMQRGTTVDLEASGGFNSYMGNALMRELQGFFFADAHEKADTVPLNGTSVTMLANTTSAYKAASGLDAFPAKAIVFASGFTNAANNGISVVTTSLAATLTTDSTKVVETPPADARVQQVGLEFASGDLALTVTGGLATLASTADAWADLDVQVGEWLFIGGDAAGDRFASGYGYGRVSAKSDAAVVLDEIAWVSTPTAGVAVGADTGSGKTVQVFAGTYVRNEKTPALIKCRSYHIERTLGSDDNGVMSEYLKGAYANELTLNIPLTSKHTVDTTYVALNHELRDGATGPKSGTHVAQPAQLPYNTSKSVFRLSMPLLDATTLQPTGLFAYVSDATFTLNNNLTIVKAVGVTGGIDVSTGDFQTGGAVTAYFNTTDGVQAIKDNSDVGFNAILAQDNKGFVYDIPLLGVGGGRINVEKDSPITVPLENFGAENANGYTASVCSFEYLPTIAMPTED